ncbi:hypothetical protein ACIQUD_02055 [Streptomyces globisporus]|uniref:hypothetical protein n=1 Tax=Streptomyces TaxID=1883 RepID=UPI00382E979E
MKAKRWHNDRPAGLQPLVVRKQSVIEHRAGTEAARRVLTGKGSLHHRVRERPLPDAALTSVYMAVRTPWGGYKPVDSDFVSRGINVMMPVFSIIGTAVSGRSL